MASIEEEMEAMMGKARAKADKIKLPPDTRTPEKKTADAKKSWETRQFARSERARINNVQMENARKKAENMTREQKGEWLRKYAPETWQKLKDQRQEGTFYK